jgi:hypothetical protein
MLTPATGSATVDLDFGSYRELRLSMAALAVQGLPPSRSFRRSLAIVVCVSW